MINVALQLMRTLFLLSAAVLITRTIVPSSQTAIAQDNDSRFFEILVVDAETQRGVPLVELTTVNNISFVTDSAGVIALDEPGLMDRQVFFHVASHGYQYPADGFGNRGVRLTTRPGGSARIELRRINVAERLYRITGQGIYRDSVMLGRDVSLQQPLLAGGVLGQDTVQTAIYGDRIHWFWGDTNRASYPLGLFKTSGAVSQLPNRGGLDPDAGVDLTYFVDGQGFSRTMAPIEGPGAVWLHGLFVLRESDEPPRMIAHYARVKSLSERFEHGLVVYDDATDTFGKLAQFDDDAMLYPRGQGMVDPQRLGDYIYFATALPFIRVRASLDHITDPTKYEAFTCLRQGTRYRKGESEIERDEQGRAVWSWKPNTDLVNTAQQRNLLALGLLSEHDLRCALRDRETNQLIDLHAGSVHWNDFRNRWIMIAGQVGAKQSWLGEIWYAESDQLEGPWINPRKIVTHDKYTFYNPAHHPFFDQQGGRLIYFEGTYTTTFSATKVPTPRYNYNQIMYRLDLAHPRLGLPPLN